MTSERSTHTDETATDYSDSVTAASLYAPSVDVSAPASNAYSLAALYRPRNFATVVGQTHVVEVLRRAVTSASVPQQILFSGGSGLGKTTIARIVAAAMLCETPLAERERGDACGNCRSCSDVTDGTHPDLIEFDAASHGGKDEIREIAARCQVLPLRSPVKIYVIDEAHGLSAPGGQAFLKLLEEPPAHVRFMLCTTDPEKMLKTNRGRCVEFELLPPNREELLTNLERICAAQGWSPPAAVLGSVLDAADPQLGVRGTVTTLAKLATVLSDAASISPELVASLLGTPSPVVLRRIVDAIDAQERRAALRALEDGRRTCADGVLRQALLLWARRQVANALPGPVTQLDRALWQLEVLLETRSGAAWLDVAVAKLASYAPDVARDVEQAAVPSPETSASRAAGPAGSPGAENATSPQQTTAPSEAVARLLAASTPTTPELRALLPRCEVTITDSEVLLAVPEELVEPMRPLIPALRTSAGRLGLPLKTRKTRPNT